MVTRRIADRDVPVIGIGTWNMERDDRASAIAAIRQALELGMTHVDTAEMYGSGRFPTSKPLAELAQRLGATPRQLALAFLARKAFAIPKSSDPAHVRELAAVPALDADAIAAIDAAFPLGPWRGLPMI